MSSITQDKYTSASKTVKYFITGININTNWLHLLTAHDCPFDIHPKKTEIFICIATDSVSLLSAAASQQYFQRQWFLSR